MQNDLREALDRLKMAAHVYEDDEMAADCATLEALLSARPLALGGQQGEARRVRHKKRGTEYTIIGVGRAQGEIADEDPVVLYRGDADGGLWVRHQAEFSDGRFEYVTTPARAEAQNEGAAGETVEWLGGGNYEPTKAMIEAGLDHNHSHNSEANMVASFKSMMVQAEIDGLINPAHPSPTPAADADRVRADRYYEALVQADLKIRSLPGTDQSDVEFIRAALKSTAAKEGGEG